MSNLNVFNPYTDEKISTQVIISKKEAFKKLHQAFCHHKEHPNGLAKEIRIQILEKLYQLLEKNSIELIELSVLEGGKPINDSKVEMQRALEGVKIGIQSIRNTNGEMIPMNLNSASKNKLAFTKKIPIGVILSISAFNHPINLAIHQIIPCIAAGCPVIYKPSLSTPLVSQRIIKLLYEAGLPEEWCSYILCDDKTIEDLAKSNLIGYISFIGASQIGWSIKRNMAPGVKIVLEHGGTAPVILAKDANLQKAVSQIAKAGFYHAGQVCVSAQKIYVHEDIVDSFVSQLNLQAQMQKIGNPLNENTLIGPIIKKIITE
jgi:acyl-CoA reductase-like NAD-dependent aldehyde dehydrogenase